MVLQTQGIDRMKQAKARLVLNHLFFGSASMGMRLVEDVNCPTAYTDGKVLGFNPDYVNSFADIAMVESLICHEALHKMLLHPMRLRGRDHRLANIAMDYVVNGIIRRAGMPIPETWLYDDVYSAPGLSFEQVYSMLKKNEPKRPEGEGGEPGKGGEKGDGPTGKGKGQGPGEKPPEGEPEGEGGTSEGGSKAPEDVKGENGAGNGAGAPEPWQAGEVREPKADDGKPLSEAARSELEQEWKTEAAAAINRAKQAGKLPGGLERYIEEVQIKKRDLEEILRDFVIKTLDGDYTYARPNKKHIIHDIYMPSMAGERIPQLVFVLDTSGSIDKDQISYFNAKINSVLTEFNTQIKVLYCDTRVIEGKDYDSNDLPIKLSAKGGGGTDFQPPFAWIEENDYDPDCMIYLTDGCCWSFPEKEPDFPVLWAVFGPDREFPWGEKVLIDPNL